MSYRLAIYRFGGLAALSKQMDLAVRRTTRTRTLEEDFLEQRDRTEDRPEYKAMLGKVLAAFTAEDPKARWEPPEQESSRRIFSMPPTVDSEFADELDYSSHLVGLLRSKRMLAKIGRTDCILRIRASVTACALEVKSGVPKLWWTFEAIPAVGDPDVHPSEKDVRRFFSLVRPLETEAIDELAAAYFGALGEVTNVENMTPEDYDVGLERVRIRFADNDDASVTALINALRFRKLAAKQIEDGEGDISALAQEGMREFSLFVKHTNAKNDPPVDPYRAEVDKKIKTPGILAVSSRQETDKDIIITGLAQRPGARTAFDHLDMAGQQRFVRFEEDRVRAFSAARRWTARLLADEALRLERARRQTAVAMDLAL